MGYLSETWGVEVRDVIVREFISADGTIDDNLAGLHEVRARMAEETARKGPAELAAESAALREELELGGWRMMRPDEGQSAG